MEYDNKTAKLINVFAHIGLLTLSLIGPALGYLLLTPMATTSLIFAFAHAIKTYANQDLDDKEHITDLTSAVYAAIFTLCALLPYIALATAGSIPGLLPVTLMLCAYISVKMAAKLIDIIYPKEANLILDTTAAYLKSAFSTHNIPTASLAVIQRFCVTPADIANTSVFEQETVADNFWSKFST